MSKSRSRRERERLRNGEALSRHEHDMMLVLADIIEATPAGQRTARMSKLLSIVRAAQQAA
ncbi:MAG: hypothetical protein RIC16_15010 [Rhodospirillales bacterium]